MKPKPAGLGSIAVRTTVGAVALILFVALALFILGGGNRWDGSPDDRLLAAMQQIAWDAQAVLDETGEVPRSLDDLQRAVYPERAVHWDSSISYQRVQTSDIRLCGEFSTPSSGQAAARPFFDVIIRLQQEFTAPRPTVGRHCYDVTLEVTEPAIREDALIFRELDAAATAAECTLTAAGALPKTIPRADSATAEQLGDPACGPRRFIGQSRQAFEYGLAGAASIRMCATFRRGYAASDKPARVFDPMRDARFGELAQSRPELGRRCYTIAMLLPDPQPQVPVSAWDEPIDVEKLPAELRGAAEQDKQAIGDAVNVLRLARCALTMGGASPTTTKEAIQMVALRPRVAERYKCGWAPSYFANPKNLPVGTYELIDNGRVRVCARFQSAWNQPLALNYYGEALTDWPTSLPELQRPVSEPGQHCFTVRLTAIGSGVT